MVPNSKPAEGGWKLVRFLVGEISDVIGLVGVKLSSYYKVFTPCLYSNIFPRPILQKSLYSIVEDSSPAPCIYFTASGELSSRRSSDYRLCTCVEVST